MTKRPDRQRKKRSDKASTIIDRIEEARKNNSTLLDLSYDQLTALPESICQLTQLQILDLSDNQLTAVPESISQLTQLQILNLSGNQLTGVPESISQLTQLQYLNLSGNQLIKLPESLRKLGLLKALFLHGNDALGLPPELLGPTQQDILFKNAQPVAPREILEYYFKVQGDQRPLNEAKLILVGRGGVGKTSIVNQLVHNLFIPEKKTEGIKITEWNLTLNTNENVRLNIWDFGGQEIMHHTHQFFLTQRSLYLLVLNGREGNEDADAEYWLKLIESFGGESPVIVVLNKIEEQPFDVNRRALQQKYPMIRDFIKTDCDSGTGLKQLRKAIERETDSLEHLRVPFPTSWFAIKDKLAGMSKNYLGFDEYRNLCDNLGEKEPDAQNALASYLHSLGIALNYRDDSRLKDMHVLNPHWVTNGIYKLLNSDKLEKQKGEIRLNDLTEILDTEEYPENMHGFLFDLMKKFELCFSFPDEDTHYLIPDLLDKQEPAETAEFNPKECLNFQYHYTVLPEGLLPRFIVRTHVLSEGPKSKRWRTGVILEFEECRALVKADTQDKKVFISVSSSASSRRRLLAVIRSDFERIHSDIRNLHPQEIVPLPEYPDENISYRELLVIEQKGLKEFPKVIGESLVNINVNELLNGVDLDNTRRTRTIERPGRAVRLFYSYSHKDETFRNQLETHLKLLHRGGFIEAWHDRKIGAGDDWRQSIDDNLNRADIILLLVSADFIASDYCYEKEMEAALMRQDRGEARVVPIIVRDVNWGKTPFSKLQALPKDGRAVSLWGKRDSAWRNVAEGIERLTEEIQKKSGLLH